MVMSFTKAATREIAGLIMAFTSGTSIVADRRELLLLSQKKHSRLFVSASLLLDGGDANILELCGCTGLVRDGGGRRMMRLRLCWNAGLENLHFGLSPLCENMLTGRDKNGKKDLADMVNWALISNLEFSFAVHEMRINETSKVTLFLFQFLSNTTHPSQILYSIEATIRRGIYMSKPLDTSALAIVSCHRSNDRL